MTLFPLDSAVIFILKDVTFHPTLRALWLSDPLPTPQSVKRRGDEVSVFHPLQFMSLLNLIITLLQIPFTNIQPFF